MAPRFERLGRGTCTSSEQGNAERVALAELINAGLVDFPATTFGERPQLSRAVTWTLEAAPACPRTGPC